MTGKRCNVATCNNSHEKTKNLEKRVSYYNFPKDPNIRKIWIAKCKRGGSWNPHSCHVCSEHFSDEDYQRDLKHELLGLPSPRGPVLKPTAIPHLLIPFESARPVNNKQNSQRKERVQRRERKKIVEKLCYPIPEDVFPSFSNPAEICETSMPNCVSCNRLEERVITLETEQANTLNKLEALQKELEDKNKTIGSLSSLLKNQKNQAKRLLCKVFTPKQIDALLHNKQKVAWETEDLLRAYTLRYLGKQSYIYLRETLNFPLPGLSTLKRWASKLNMHQGILFDVIKLMKIGGIDFNEEQKLTVLHFNEMKVRSVYEKDSPRDYALGPHSYVQVVMAQGLIASWKQPIFVGFDVKMTKELLTEIVTLLWDSDYQVVACGSDCTGGNVGLWKELGITIENPKWSHPVLAEASIYYFPDVPHLIKVIRNWFIDSGFILSNSSIIDKSCLNELISHNTSKITACYKLKELHTTCEKSQRQNVNLACELFSHSTAVALKQFSKTEQANNTSDFIELVNSWFDIFNSYAPNVQYRESIPSKCAYGLNLTEQNNILNQMYSEVNAMRCVGKSSLQTFQKAVLISIKSLQNLFLEIKSKYDNVSFFLTHKLNQDCLKNLFSQLRTRGCPHDHPTPLEVIYRLRLISLGKSPEVVQGQLNTVDGGSEEFLVGKVVSRADVLPTTL